jgi:hypothetical protein
VATIKVIEIIGTSNTSWEDAARNAVRSARETLHGLTGVDVKAWTGKVGPDGLIEEYHATVKIAFRVAGHDED